MGDIIAGGDTDTYINGTYAHESVDYTLKYSGISYFDENDGVLNVIGPGWNIPIENASAYVKLPGEILELICFTGPDGSQLQDCTMDKDTERSFSVTPNGILDAYEGYTFVSSCKRVVLRTQQKNRYSLGY